MGKHRAPEPNKVSFLGSTAGIFAAMALVGGIFVAGQVTGSGPFANDKQPPPIEHKIDGGSQALPENIVVTGTATTNLPGPATPPSVPTGGTTVIVPVPGSQTPTQPPTQNPSPNPSPAKPDVGVQAEVDTPILGLDTDVELRVPLLGQAAETVEHVVTSVTDPVTDTVKNLLSE